MKKLNSIIVALIFIVGVDVCAQIKMDASGNVSIGNVSSPKGVLHYNGDLYGKGHVFLHAYQGDGSSGTAFIQARDKSGNSTIGLQFRTQNSGSIVNVMSMSGSGSTSFSKYVMFQEDISILEDLSLMGNQLTYGELQIGSTGITTNLSLTAENGAYFFVPGGYNGSADYGIGMGVLPSSTITLQVAGGDEGDYAIKAYGSCYTTGLWYTSDETLKKDIAEIDSPLENLMKVEGKSYYYKSIEEIKSIKKVKNSTDSIVIKTKTGSDSLKFEIEGPYLSLPKGKKFGVLAQDIVSVFPELVRYDTLDEVYAVDYIGLIPVLVEAIKEQQTLIVENEKRISVLESKLKNQESTSSINTESEYSFKSSSIIESNEELLNTNSLYQNVPNPFNNETEISYYLDEDVSSAYLYIYNMNGNQLKSIEIKNTGKGSVVIGGGEFNAGMYLYTMVVDGQVIETKQMILTD